MSGERKVCNCPIAFTTILSKGMRTVKSRRLTTKNNNVVVASINCQERSKVDLTIYLTEEMLKSLKFLGKSRVVVLNTFNIFDKTWHKVCLFEVDFLKQPQLKKKTVMVKKYNVGKYSNSSGLI